MGLATSMGSPLKPSKIQVSRFLKSLDKLIRVKLVPVMFKPENGFGFAKLIDSLLLFDQATGAASFLA